MKICCIEKDNIPLKYLQKEVFLSDNIFDEILMSQIQWKDREFLEQSIQYKQIIPYLLVENENKELACYQRKGREKRLHDLYSCGVGGHVELVDKKNTIEETLLEGAIRELEEEFVYFSSCNYALKYLGVIHEEKSKVGLYHIGVVYVVNVQNSKALLPAEELHNFSWQKSSSLKQMHLEHWSSLALNLYMEVK